MYVKRISLNKIKEVKETHPSNFLFHSFNIFREHENWSDFKKQGKVLNKYLSNEYKKQYKDYEISPNFLDNKISEKFKTNTFNLNLSVSDDQKLYLDKIIQLSKKHNFELLFLTLPMYDVYYKKKASDFGNINEYLKKIAFANINVKTLDMNNYKISYGKDYIKREKLGFNQHLNYRGQIMASNILSDYINNNYSFEKRKNYLNEKVENLIYNLDYTREKSFKTNINKINNKTTKNKDSIFIKSNQEIRIQGWMFEEHTNYFEHKQKHIALKSKNFTYLSIPRQVKETKSPQREKRFGSIAKNTNFDFKAPARLLEKGFYDVYLILETSKGDFFVNRYNKKTIIIE